MEDAALSEIDFYIGKRLREQRMRKDCTLAQIADCLGVSLQQVQKYEQGKARIPAIFLYKVAQILDVTPSYFYEGLSGGSHWENSGSGKINAQKIQQLTVCLIEDDSSDEMIMREIFESAPISIRVISFHNGDSAFDFFRYQGTHVFSDKPDLIFLDLNVPKRNGQQILKDLKRDAATKDIPVIIVTNSLNSADLVQCYQNFASGYIAKSFDFVSFRAKILQSLEYWSQVTLIPRHCWAGQTKAL